MSEGEYKYAFDADMDSPRRRLEEARNEEINRLLGERQKLFAELQQKLLDSKDLDSEKREEKIKNDPGILAINQRLLELTDSRGAVRFAKEKEQERAMAAVAAQDAASIKEIISDVSSGRAADEIVPIGESGEHHAEKHDDSLLLNLEKRNQEIWDKFLSTDFEPNVDGMRMKFKLMRESIDEYVFDLGGCLAYLSNKRKDYYNRQITDLNNRIGDLLAARLPNASYQQLEKISREAFVLFEDYKNLHYSAVQEALRVIS